MLACAFSRALAARRTADGDESDEISRTLALVEI
jgi:hypothetical protein